MRVEFAAWAESHSVQNQDTVFLTGDLGFMALESLREKMGSRFINAGVSEQNMVSMAAGLAREGLNPICYSIAPFAVFRPAEQIRVDVCLHNLNVKIVGNGGGYGYGIMGSTHHAIEDIAYLSSLQKMICYIPAFNEDVPEVCSAMMQYKGPSYLRLNVGKKPKEFSSPAYSAIRKWMSGKDLTIVSCGPVGLHAFQAIADQATGCTADLFSVSEIPVLNLSSELVESIRRTGKVLVIEEHVARGGLGENLGRLLLLNGINCKFKHISALGYPNGLYGSQAYHQKISGLDAASIVLSIRDFVGNSR